MKFSEYIQRWKYDCRINVSEDWEIAQDNMLDLHILPILGDLDLISIGHLDISKVMKFSKSKGHSSSMQLQIYLLLSKIFNDAKDFHELIEKTPIKRKYHRPKHVYSKRTPLTKDQAVYMLEAVTDYWFSNAVWIETLAGPRISDIMALRWKMIDWERGGIHVTESYKRRTKRVRKPKNKVTGFYFMADDLIEYLLKRRGAPNDFVCPGPNGGMMSYHSYQKAIKAFGKRIGIPNLSSHILRHTLAALMRINGASDGAIGQQLNHRCRKTTEAYLHEVGDHIKATVGSVLKVGLKKDKAS